MAINKKYYDNLCNSKLFLGASGNVVKQLLTESDIKKYKKNEIIIQNSETEGVLGIFLKGNAIFTLGSESNEIILNTLCVGDVFGFSSVFDMENEAKYNIKITASSTIMFINENKLKEMLEEDEKILQNYLYLLTDNIRFLSRKIEGFTAKSAEEKLAAFLYENMKCIKEKDEKKYFVNLGLSMSKLSNALGLGRATLYRAMDTLQNNYVVIRNKKEIRIIDVNKLTKLCNKRGENV